VTYQYQIWGKGGFTNPVVVTPTPVLGRVLMHYASLFLMIVLPTA
jgi:hypothetical protein